MDDGMMLIINDNGEAEIYDDTYDITIHCTSEEEKDEALRRLNSTHWIPCSERLPDKEGRYICTVNSELHDVRDMFFKPNPWGNKDQNIWILTDGCYAFNWFVLAWMPLPDPYKEVE